MTKNEFALLVDCMVETYGVHSYLNNEDDIEENNLWFECLVAWILWTMKHLQKMKNSHADSAVLSAENL